MQSQPASRFPSSKGSCSRVETDTGTATVTGWCVSPSTVQCEDVTNRGRELGEPRSTCIVQSSPQESPSTVQCEGVTDRGVGHPNPAQGITPLVSPSTVQCEGVTIGGEVSRSSSTRFISHKSPSTVQCEGVTERGRECQQPTPVFVDQSKLQIFSPSEDGCIDGATLFVPPHITSDSGTGCNRLSAFPVLPAEGALGADALLQRPRADSGFRALEPGLVKIYDAVVRVGVPNYRGARVSVPSALNIPAWRQVEHLLDDQSLVDCLEFGFPVGFMGNTPPATSIQNHTSARANPSRILDYLATEKGHDAMVGQFHAPPFSPWFRTNPAMTRPKRDSDKLRVRMQCQQSCAVWVSGWGRFQAEASHTLGSGSAGSTVGQRVSHV